MQHYVGIDVGKTRLFAAALTIDGASGQIVFSPSTEIPAVLSWTLAMKLVGVGIDAPAAHSVGLATTGTRRIAEERLSIGGCYGTPPIGASLPGWMATGMHTHRHLSAELDTDINLAGTGRVFEVHPTYGFRSMLGVDETPTRVRCDPTRILRPKSPRGSVGHRQRVEMLRVVLAQLGVEWTPSLSAQLLSRLDWADAAVSAVLAALRARGMTRGIGEPTEGTIVIADPAAMPFRDEVRAAAVAIPMSPTALTTSTSATVGDSRATGDGESAAECALLRLGGEGLGSLSRENTVEALRGQLSERQIVIPVGVALIGQEWCGRAAQDGLWLLVANAGVVVMALHVVTIVGHGRGVRTPKADVLGENRDPWPSVEASDYWFIGDLLVGELDIPVTELSTRQRGEWVRGVPPNQSAWLGARVESDALAARLRDARAEPD